jgi:drug/metabolite transporter (DMT)-like permease
MINGILLGLGAAFAQALSYLCSRVFVDKYPRDPLLLLALSHVLMGLFSLALLPFCWPREMPPLREYVLPLLSCSLAYLQGQFCLFLALRHANASRVSPLLGLKILLLALIATLFLGQRYTTLQWVAVALSAGAALMLIRSGPGIRAATIGWVLAACLGYSLSDLSIKWLVGKFLPLGLLHASLLSACLSYFFCGLVGLALLPAVPRRPQGVQWLQVAPFAVAWFVAMLLLYACFAEIGVVYGNIVQSTRGVLSIVMGSLVAAYGWRHLEEQVPRGLLIRRILAACLITAAIALFHLGA